MVDRQIPLGTISTCVSCGEVTRFDGKTWLCNDCREERNLDY